MLLQLLCCCALFTELIFGQYYKINVKKVIVYVVHGYGKNNNKNMCVVTRVVIGSRAGYHHVKVHAVEQKYITVEYINENKLLKINYRNTSDYYKLYFKYLRGAAYTVSVPFRQRSRPFLKYQTLSECLLL